MIAGPARILGAIRAARPALALKAAAAAGAAAAFLALSGIADRFRRAERSEGKGEYAAAARAFAGFAARRPSDPRAPEALARAAWIYHRVFSRCAEARPLYERAARGYPGSPWGRAARQALLDCPEYFPLRDGMRWVYGDPQTGGEVFRREVAAAELEPPASLATGDAAAADRMPAGVRRMLLGTRARLGSADFAGAKRVTASTLHYVKEDWAVWEIASADKTPILRYPFTPGSSWTGRRRGADVEFTIETDSATVTVRAGTFANCLKVRDRAAGQEGWKYEYYAPGVGKLKTTTGGPEGEADAIFELKSVEVPPPR